MLNLLMHQIVGQVFVAILSVTRFNS